MRLVEPNFKINNYPMYGLNHNRSFLKAPLCECGCGQPAHLLLKTDEDVTEFCKSALFMYECPDSAIFVVFNDGRMKAYIKLLLDDEVQVIELESADNDTHMFAELDGEFRFYCYNLIIEVEPGLWDIQS